MLIIRNRNTYVCVPSLRRGDDILAEFRYRHGLHPSKVQLKDVIKLLEEAKVPYYEIEKIRITKKRIKSSPKADSYNDSPSDFEKHLKQMERQQNDANEQFALENLIILEELREANLINPVLPSSKIGINRKNYARDGNNVWRQEINQINPGIANQINPRIANFEGIRVAVETLEENAPVEIADEVVDEILGEPNNDLDARIRNRNNDLRGAQRIMRERLRENREDLPQ